MKEYKITSQNILGKSNSDCILHKDDPVWKMLGKDAPKSFGAYLVNVEITHKDPRDLK